MGNARIRTSILWVTVHIFVCAVLFLRLFLDLSIVKRTPKAASFQHPGSSPREP
jgi:hypothetical protein